MEGIGMTIEMTVEGHTGLGVAVQDVHGPGAVHPVKAEGVREKAKDPTHALGVGVSPMAEVKEIVMVQGAVQGVLVQLRRG